MLRKNVASQVVTFNLVNATTGAALTGATVTTKVTLDGTQSASAGTLTELGTGQYKYVPTQGETNGASVGFSFTAANAVPVNLHCFTIGQDPALATLDTNVTKWLGTAAAAPATAGIPKVAIEAAGDFAQGAADKVWSTATRALTDKIGFALSAAGVQAIWDAAVAALTTAGSIGKRLVDDLTGDIYARLGAPAGASIAADIATTNGYLDTEIAAILAAVDTEVAAIKAKTDNLPEGISKNTALPNFEFFMVDSADHVTGKTGLTVTAERSIDGGAFAACANSPATEVANGIYKILLAASDLNGDFITLKMTSAGADATIIAIKTEVP